MCDDHDWTLTAPWWGWTKTGGTGPKPRATRPLLQMYESSDPVSGFVKDPQKRLKYGDQDVVWRPVGTAKNSSGKWRTLSSYTLVKDPNDTRKLFLPSHKRFYLVVCELHCDTAGLPSVNRDKVCETGFVVRRRRLSFAPEHAPAAQALVDQIADLTGQIAALDRGGTSRLLKKRAKLTRGGVIGMISAIAPQSGRVADAVKAKDEARRALLQAQLATARAQLQAWKTDSGAVSVAEGWIPDADAENVGEWAVVDDQPSAIEEVIYPLSPLIADVRKPDHDATGKTIYFGFLPVGSREVEVNGCARFDERTRYEVRCFVRRHKCDCPKTGERNDCGGELVWSAATEVFQLAAHFDPVGTGNHPVNIQMPDLPSLAATVGAKLPVAFNWPENSALNISADDEGKPKNPSTTPGFQICFFSIPLITIIAWFVLNLFLPIVVFLFGLWFLLGLKFCIPPSISLSAGASAHADISGKIDASLSAGLDLSLEAGINADIALTGNLGADFNVFNMDDPTYKQLVGAVAGPPPVPEHYEPISKSTGVQTPGQKIIAERENYAVATLRQSQLGDRTAEVESGDVTAALLWEQRVERWEVGA
ncbi:MAG TPA: hypothetical protein VJT67_06910 [Longimicrobiaceae bacterium]|nr:hypothetical protein [Longimicrobiaceae bacterium]